MKEDSAQSVGRVQAGRSVVHPQPRWLDGAALRLPGAPRLRWKIGGRTRVRVIKH